SPKVVKGSLYGRTHQVGIAPDSSLPVRKAIVQRGPLRSSVANFCSIQILMHIQKYKNAGLSNRFDLLLNPGQIAIAKLTRPGLQRTPVNPIPNHIYAPLLKLMKHGITDGGHKRVLR